jgi:hypothetical protein
VYIVRLKSGARIGDFGMVVHLETIERSHSGLAGDSLEPAVFHGEHGESVGTRILETK